MIKNRVEVFFYAAKLLLSGGITNTSNSEHITRITESTDGGEGGAEDDFVIRRGATTDGCPRVAQEYLCPCLKVFRKYSYVSVMYRLCIGYPIRRLRKRQHKDTTKFRDIFGIFSGYTRPFPKRVPIPLTGEGRY